MAVFRAILAATALACSCMAGWAVAQGGSAAAQGRSAPGTAGASPTAVATEPPLNDIAVFDSAVATIRASFFDPEFNHAPLDSTSAWRRSQLVAAGASADVQRQVRDLLAELRYSGCRFYREGRAPDFTPAFRVRQTVDGVVVVAVQPGSDCEKAGLFKGDYLVTHESDLPGARGSMLTLRVRTGDGVEWSQPVRRDGFSSTESDLGWTVYAKRVGYLRVSRLHDPTVVDTAMQHVSKFPDLILDVRGCADADVSVLALLSQFAEKSSNAGFVANRRGLETLGRAMIVKYPRGTAESTGSPWLFHPTLSERGLLVLRVQPVEKPYSGEVVVLADEGTAGFAELIPRWFREQKRGRVIGRITAGRGGLSAALRAAQGWFLELPTAALFAADGLPLEGRGAVPTNFVKWRQIDVRAGADPDIERALQLLGADQAEP
ncbi:MAG: hypothetical protein HZB25_04440 [Candidatus Eisenbacteria bacterium]|nr:hypothetical protein [Candidatus Eisenbacteria bacterium]